MTGVLYIIPYITDWHGGVVEVHLSKEKSGYYVEINFLLDYWKIIVLQKVLEPD